MNAKGEAHYYLAIDAGGTKTDFLLADGDTELARVRTGSIKLLNTPVETAEANLVSALEMLERQTGVGASENVRTCIGMSGYSVPLVADWVREQFGRRTGGELLLCGDEEIALDAAFRGGRGVLALAGTGSNVAGRTGTGQLLRAGGWGPVLADEGSGHWIGLRAVRSVFRAMDEGGRTMLADAILRAWGLSSVEQLIQLGNRTPPAPFAELTPVVLECAEAGDAAATEVLREAGEELARLTTHVIRRLQELEGADGELPEVALAGSVLQSVTPVRRAMTDALRRRWPTVVVAPDTVDPIAGALWRARAGSI